jgi:hypothetical protein
MSMGTFYVGHIYVGTPAQDLTVIFHTSSGHVIIPHKACKDATCLEHRRYAPWESKTAQDVQLNGSLVTPGHRLAGSHASRQAVVLGYTDSDLGKGDAKSLLVMDHVCFKARSGENGCVDMQVLAATVLPDVPFRAMPNDGIVGLGLESLTAGPLCSFFGRYLNGSRSRLAQFGVSLGRDTGEIFFGGQDDSRYLGRLNWFPVINPDDGYWQFNIVSVAVGGILVDACDHGCQGVVDTAATRLGVQEANLPSLEKALTSNKGENGDCEGPVLSFDLGGFTLKLEPQDYAGDDCKPQLGPLNLESMKFHGVYAFGQTVLRKYYAAFDWDKQQVGFAPTSGDSSEEASDAATV